MQTPNKNGEYPQNHHKHQTCISTERHFKHAKHEIKDLITALLEKKQTLKYDALTPAQEWGYSVGHFMNDITGACWFK